MGGCASNEEWGKHEKRKSCDVVLGEEDIHALLGEELLEASNAAALPL